MPLTRSQIRKGPIAPPPDREDGTSNAAESHSIVEASISERPSIPSARDMATNKTDSGEKITRVDEVSTPKKTAGNVNDRVGDRDKTRLGTNAADTNAVEAESLATIGTVTQEAKGVAREHDISRSEINAKEYDVKNAESGNAVVRKGGGSVEEKDEPTGNVLKPSEEKTGLRKLVGKRIERNTEIADHGATQDLANTSRDGDDSDGDDSDGDDSDGIGEHRGLATRPGVLRRKRTMRSSAQTERKREVRRLRKAVHDSEYDSESGEENECVVERSLLPNDLLIEGGNRTAFKHKLLSGEEIVVNFLDVYHTSLNRFINENVIHIACDILLREKGSIPERGWVYMHETALVSKIMKKEAFDHRVLSVSRMESILKSNVLIVPIHTSVSNHWSLLMLTNLEHIYDAALAVESPKRGLFEKPSLCENQTKPLATHFDSIKSSGHKSCAMHFRRLIEYGINDAWKRLNKGSKRTPMFRTFIARSLPFNEARVQQQTDGCTCGWRAVDSVRFIAGHQPRSRRHTTDTDWLSVLRREVDTQHEEIAKHTLRFMQSNISNRLTDLPSMFYPVHSVIDGVCSSAFETDLDKLNYTLATFFKSHKGDADKARSNAKKIAQAQKYEEVYDAVIKEMKRKGLNIRRKLGRDVKMSTSHFRTIAKYLFHYPQGETFASCLYYTRYNYPDSMLVCTGVNILLFKTPKLFGESLASSASRVRRSKRVHYEMAVFLDWDRSKARHWDTVARFRLQELLIHFTGISEVVLRACCRQAKYVEENGHESEEGKAQGILSEDFVVEDDDDDASWSFQRSVTFEDGENENGQVRCSVSPLYIGSALPSCLSAAERVANDAILDCTTDFETHCKRVLQLSSPKMKISDIERIVTGSSMATIPRTFSQHFQQQLLARIKMMWGHVLSGDFLQSSVEPIILQSIKAATTYFERNGKLFLKISTPADALVSERVAKRVKRSREATNAMVVAEESIEGALASSASKAVEVVERTVTDTRSFGLGAHTTCTRTYTSSPLNEFLSLLFYVLQGCRGHERSDSFLCGDRGIQKWGSELPECQKMLEDVWRNFTEGVKKLAADYSTSIASDEEDSFERYIAKLKYEVVVRAASKITDCNDRNAQSRACLYKSDVFCYEVPNCCRDDPSMKIGREFHFCFRGQEDIALWYGIVTEVSCETLRNDKAGIAIAGEKCAIGDFPIDPNDAPRLHKLKVAVRIKSDVELWDDARDVVGNGNGFVGVRAYECVRIVFAFHNGENQYVYPHPVKSNYTHSFLGIISSPCRQLDNGHDQRNPRYVGPMVFEVDVIVHDDVAQKSGCPCSIGDLITRFHKVTGGDGTGYSGCYLMPLNDMSLNEDVWQYNGLCSATNLPMPFKLAFFDASMSDAYQQEQKKGDYNAIKALYSSNVAELLSFPSKKTLEAEHDQHIRAAALQCDSRLNKEQLCVTETVLREWRTREAPNNSINLGMRESDVREHLRALGTVSNVALKWWGSRSHFVQGPPGTGKTRMLAALLSVVLEHLDQNERVLVACETNKALDDIFVDVVNNFRGKAAYHRVYESLVRIGSSKLKLVQDREVGRMQARDRVEAVEKARVVFTTFGSSHRSELSDSRTPFSILLFEETCLAKETMALHTLSVGLRLGHVAEREDSRKVVFVCVADPNQLHEEDYAALPVSRKVSKHFFDRAFEQEKDMRGDTCMMLKRQYRMNPALASFVSRQFYEGDLITETDGDLCWKDSTLFKGLREHTRFPVCNMMVVDTSLEEERAREKVGIGRSFYNLFEINVIVKMLT